MRRVVTVPSRAVHRRMRLLPLGLMLCSAAGTADAAPRVHPPSVKQAYLAARAEGARPSTRLAELTDDLRAQLLPEAFGRRVIDDWNRLTPEQRAEFEALADQVILRQLRDDLIPLICSRRDRIESAEETCDADVCAGRVTVRHHVDGDSFQVTLVFERRNGGWHFVTSRAPAYDLPEPHSDDPNAIGGDRYDVVGHWRHRLGRGNYDAALEALRQIGRYRGTRP